MSVTLVETAPSRTADAPMVEIKPTIRTPSQTALPQTTLAMEAYVPVLLANNGACGGVNQLFRAQIELTTRGLTPDGYVVEVGAFTATLESRFRANGDMLRATCEELAGGILRIAYDQVGPRLINAMARVYNATGHVTITWRAGEVVPPFPRLATVAEERETRQNLRPRAGC